MVEWPPAKEKTSWSVKCGVFCWALPCTLIALLAIVSYIGSSLGKETDCNDECSEKLWPDDSEPSMSCKEDCSKDYSTLSTSDAWRRCVEDSCKAEAFNATTAFHKEFGSLPVIDIDETFSALDVCTEDNVTQCKKCIHECWNSTGLKQMSHDSRSCIDESCGTLIAAEDETFQPCVADCKENGSGIFGFITKSLVGMLVGFMITPFCCALGNCSFAMYGEAFDCSSCTFSTAIGHLSCMISAVATLVVIIFVCFFLSTSRCLIGNSADGECAWLGYGALLYVVYIFPSMIGALLAVLCSRLCLRNSAEQSELTPEDTPLKTLSNELGRELA